MLRGIAMTNSIFVGRLQAQSVRLTYIFIRINRPKYSASTSDVLCGRAKYIFHA